LLHFSKVSTSRHQVSCRLAIYGSYISQNRPAFLDNGNVSKANDEIHANVLLAYFGEHCDLTTLTENDQRAFVSKRDS
jgi:hypothetical protein